MRALIEAQRRRIESDLGRLDEPQLRFDLDTPEERRQRELDIQAWRGRLAKIDSEIEEQPVRILAGYEVRARRLEPVGSSICGRRPGDGKRSADPCRDRRA